MGKNCDSKRVTQNTKNKSPAGGGAPSKQKSEELIRVTSDQLVINIFRKPAMTRRKGEC